MKTRPTAAPCWYELATALGGLGRHEEALEARVAELEAVVRTLATERETPAPEAPTADADRLEAIAEGLFPQI